MYISTEQINIVIKSLKNYEELLSDGYKYYCGEEEVDITLEKIAIDIIEKLNKVIYRGT